MPLVCTSPKQVILKYTSIKPTKITVSAPALVGAAGLGLFHHRISSNLYRYTLPSPDSEFTWEFIRDPEYDNLEYPIYFTYTHPNADPPTDSFKAFLSNRWKNPSLWVDENNVVRWQMGEGSPITDLEKLGHLKISSPGGTLGFYKVDSYSPGTSWYQVSEISIGNPQPSKNIPYSYLLKLYIDGTLHDTKRIGNDVESEPEQRIFIEEGEPDEPVSETFSFPDNPFSVEVKLKEGTEYTYQIIKKNSEDTSEEEAEIIYNFFGIDPDILCFSEEEECPDNSCKVDCGNHYCCYEADGYSVYSFAK